LPERSAVRARRSGGGREVPVGPSGQLAGGDLMRFGQESIADRWAPRALQLLSIMGPGAAPT